jgi:hypothetical protein
LEANLAIGEGEEKFGMRKRSDKERSLRALQK